MEGAVDGKVAKTARAGVSKEVAGARYLIAQDGLKVSSNPYSFGTGYRLTTHPDRFGIDAGAL